MQDFAAIGFAKAGSGGLRYSSVLKNVFDEMMHCSSENATEDNVFSHLAREIEQGEWILLGSEVKQARSLHDFAFPVQNAAVRRLLCEYASLIATFLPVKVPLAKSVLMHESDGAEPSASASLPKSITRSCLFLAQFAELVAETSEDLEMPAKKRRTASVASGTSILIATKSIAVLLERLLKVDDPYLKPFLARTLAVPLAKVIAAAKDHAHLMLTSAYEVFVSCAQFVLHDDLQFQNTLKKFGALLNADEHESIAAMLDTTADLLVAGLTHSNEKIKSAAADIWRKSFEKAQVLAYPDRFRLGSDLRLLSRYSLLGSYWPTRRGSSR